MQVVAFESHSHQRSLFHPDSEYVLMGEILKLLPVPSASENPLQMCNTTARMLISGEISVVRPLRKTFLTTAWPLIPSLSESAHLHVCANFNQIIIQHQRIPECNEVVTFSGNLLAMQQKVAIVALDEITYLPRTTATVQQT